MRVPLKFLLLVTLTCSLIGACPVQAQFRKAVFDALTIKGHPDPPPKLWKVVVVPAALTTVGLVSMTGNGILNRYDIQEARNKNFPNFQTNIDDYLQYVPIVAVYGFNASGIKGKNNFGNRTALLVKSELIMAVLTFSLKNITEVPRPDTGETNSFPSGHTAQAFMAATFMAKEYGEKSIWYSVGAYSVATSVGVLRVLNNRHWASDVLVGAAVGILSTNIAYLTHQYKWGGQRNRVVFLPSYSGSTGGIYLSYNFR